MTLLTYTIFDNVWPKKKHTHQHKMTWKEFVRFIKAQEDEPYDEKKDCPLISLCSYGVTPSPKGYLRHAANVEEVYGIELDYDDGEVSPEEACEKFKATNVRALIATSPSHTPEHPRWRALLPLSEPVAPDRRAEMVAKANGILDGIAARESFTLSQSFYIGHVKTAEYHVYTSKGECIDTTDVRPRYPKGSKKDGKGGAFDEIPDDVFIEAFEKGEGRYDAVLALTSRWIAKGRNPKKVRKELRTYVRQSKHDPTTDGGENLYEEIDRQIASAIQKFGKTSKKAKTVSISDAIARSEQREREADPDEWVRRVLAGEHPGRVDFAGIKSRTIPPQEWVVENFIPRDVLTLVHGNGGVGKSLVMLSLAASVAAGKDTMGCKVNKGPVIVISAEETRTRLESRVLSIMLAQGIEERDIGKNMVLMSQLKGGFPMFHLRDEEPQAAPGFYKLKALIDGFKPSMVVIENAANVFHANENFRAEVEPFTALLNEQAEATHCAIVLIGHDSKLGEYSGSSHWNNGPRHRIHITRDNDVEGKPITAEVKKTNCGEPGVYVMGRWSDDYHCFVLGSLVSRGTLRGDQMQLLRTLADAVKAGKRISTAKQSTNNVRNALKDSAFVGSLKPDTVFKLVGELLVSKFIEAADITDKKTGNTRKGAISITEKGHAQLHDEDLPISEEEMDDELEDAPRVARKRAGRFKARNP